MTAAARWPARGDPANNQLDRPSAIGRIWSLYPVVVCRKRAVVGEAHERGPPPEAVVDGFGGCRAVGDLLRVHDEPSVQGIGPRLRSFAAYAQSLGGVEVADRGLDLVQAPEQLERLAGDLALVIDA